MRRSRCRVVPLTIRGRPASGPPFPLRPSANAPHPLTDVLGLRFRLGNAGPELRAMALLPEPSKLIERLLAGQAPFDEEATDHRAGASDARTAVHVRGPR